MTRQSDAVEALTLATVRRIHYQEACELAAKDFAVAMHLAWQLTLDERHLHNWNMRLGRANAEERQAALLLELRSRLLLLAVRACEGDALPFAPEQTADHHGPTTRAVNRLLGPLRHPP